MSVIDLSELKAKKSGNPLDQAAPMTPEDEAELEALVKVHGGETATDETSDALPVRTAFLVFVDEDGHALATSDLGMKITRRYLPSFDDMYGACSQVMRDIQVSATAQNSAMMTSQLIQQQAQQAFEQKRAQTIANQLNLKGKH